MSGDIGVWPTLPYHPGYGQWVEFAVAPPVITVTSEAHLAVCDELAAAKQRISDLEAALDNWKKLRSDKGEVPKAEDKGGDLQKAFGKINRGWLP